MEGRKVEKVEGGYHYRGVGIGLTKSKVLQRLGRRRRVGWESEIPTHTEVKKARILLKNNPKVNMRGVRKNQNFYPRSRSVQPSASSSGQR